MDIKEILNYGTLTELRINQSIEDIETTNIFVSIDNNINFTYRVEKDIDSIIEKKRRYKFLGQNRYKINRFY